MRKEYDIKKLNPRKNPYSNRVKKPDGDIVEVGKRYK